MNSSERNMIIFTVHTLHAVLLNATVKNYGTVIIYREMKWKEIETDLLL